MAKTPSYRYMGGKSRLRKWLTFYFPKSGRIYLEPFVGLGNVFFQSRKELKFEQWQLGDTNDFLQCLQDIKIEELPDRVPDKESFIKWKESKNCISKVIEPRITFAGKGYAFGFDKGDPSHPPYNGFLYRETCSEAKKLLEGVLFKTCDWCDWDYDNLEAEDFVYFDPPYMNTRTPYTDICHVKLVEILNKAKFKWALSGYQNDLYKNKLKFSHRYDKVRNSEIKGSNKRKYIPVTESLWTNY